MERGALDVLIEVDAVMRKKSLTKFYDAIMEVRRKRKRREKTQKTSNKQRKQKYKLNTQRLKMRLNLSHNRNDNVLIEDQPFATWSDHHYPKKIKFLSFGPSSSSQCRPRYSWYYITMSPAHCNNFSKLASLSRQDSETQSRFLDLILQEFNIRLWPFQWIYIYISPPSYIHHHY